MNLCDMIICNAMPVKQEDGSLSTSRLLTGFTQLGASQGWDTTVAANLLTSFANSSDPLPSIAVLRCEEAVSNKRKMPEDSDSWSEGDSEGPPTKKQYLSRGEHMRERPDLHAAARSGQRHWSNKLRALRSEWEQKRVGAASAHFAEQIRMCNKAHIKSQHECLLRTLQILALEGIVSPGPFVDNERESFLGWTGFQINPRMHHEFQLRIAAMFEEGTKQNTINNAFRRAGLVPDQCWGRAWSGLAAFTYQPDRRAVYGRGNKRDMSPTA